MSLFLRAPFALFVALATFGCRGGERAGPPTDKAGAAASASAQPSAAQTETVTLSIADGTGRLGTFVLAPGKPGVLTLETEAGSAARLKEECDRINATESVSVDVEERPRSGHYELESRAAKRGTKAYPDVVHTLLVSKGFKVTRER